MSGTTLESSHNFYSEVSEVLDIYRQMVGG